MVTTIEYALMAGAAYSNTRSQARDFVPPGWVEISGAAIEFTGFEAHSYQRGEEIVIAFTGTEPGSPADWANNIALGFALPSLQLGNAAVYYETIKSDHPGVKISFTGHSLGGGLASLLAIIFDVKGVTFDQAPFGLTAMNHATYIGMALYLAAHGIVDGALAPALIPVLWPLFVESRYSNVSSISVEGEILSVSALSPFRIVGTGLSEALRHGGIGLSSNDLHSIALLVALEYDHPAFGLSPFAVATYNLPFLVKDLFSASLYAGNPHTNVIPDILYHLINYNSGLSLLQAFASDLSKLGSVVGPNNDQTRESLLIILLQHEYNTTSVQPIEIFSDLVGGIRVDLSQPIGNTKVNSPADIRGWNTQGLPSLRAAIDAAIGADTAAITATHNFLDNTLHRLTIGLDSSINATSPNDGGQDFMLSNAAGGRLSGGNGNDLLIGLGGADWLNGGTGQDTIYGGGGSDTFVVKQSLGPGDLVTIFDNAGAQDVVNVVADIAGHLASLGKTRFFVEGGFLAIYVYDSTVASTQLAKVLISRTGTVPDVESLIISAADGSYDSYNLATALSWAMAGTPDNTGHQVPVHGVGGVVQGGDGGGPVTIGASAGNDVIYLGSGADSLDALAGNDWIDGGAGNDTLIGGLGNDTLYGGDGNDSINGGDGNDVVYGGAGNDTLVISGSSGNDSINAGPGDDTITLSGRIGVATIDGGSGSDTLSFDGTVSGSGQFMAFGLQKPDSSWLYFGNYFDQNTSSLGGTTPTINLLQAALAGGPLQLRYSFSTYVNSVESVSWTGLETVNVKGGHNADSIVFINGTEYAGADDIDTFYADWSSWTEAVTWTNAKSASNSALSDEVVALIGATHQVKVSGMERLLILTGSGNDTIVQNVTGTNDEFRLGAGNDSLTLAGGSSGGNDSVDLGAGNDTLVISGSSGNDSINAGPGDDTITLSGRIGVATIDGGSGSDTLSFDGTVSGSGQFMAFGLQKPDSSWLYFGNYFDQNTSSLGGTTPTINLLQAALAGGPLQLRYSFSTYVNSVESVSWTGLETVNVKGGHNADSIVFINGTEYAGADDIDTFYADWSSWTEAVTWTNAKSASNSALSDEVVALIGATHQVKVSGMERLLILTGSGNDTIVQNVTGTDDEIVSGDGDDNISTNSGNDRINAGPGNDLLDGGSGTDTMTGGTGNDTYVIDVAADVIIELPNEGTDTVQSPITYTLGANLENLALTGVAAINGTGNAANNVLLGNSAANSLTGGAGNDTLDGGAGADTAVFSGPFADYIVSYNSVLASFTLQDKVNGRDGTDSVVAVESFKFSDGTRTAASLIPPPNIAPTSSNGVASTLEDTPLNGTLPSATDADGDLISYAKRADPAHGTLTVNANGSFSYNPAGNYSGADQFSFSVSDNKGGSNTYTESLTITAVNDPPVAINATTSGNEDTPITGTVVANDVDSATLSYSVVAGPTHGSVTLAANGGYTYTPNLDFNGSDSFTFRANDGLLNSNTATVAITVIAVNDAPVVVNAIPDQGATAGTAFNFVVAANAFSDPEGSALSYSATLLNGAALPAWLTFNPGTRSFAGTPAAADVATLDVKVTASDGSLSATDTFFLVVSIQANRPPIASGGSANAVEDTVLNGTLPVASDPDGDAVSYLKAINPAHGAVVVNANGSFTYTPNADYNGSDSFTFSVNDGKGGSNTYTESLTITAVNDAPVAANGSAAGNEDTPIAGAALASDVDTFALIFSVVSQPANGAVAMAGNGSYTYTPNLNFSGNDSFTFRANDGTSNSNTATISITVTAVNDAPVATPGTLIGNEDTAMAATALATDVDSATLTFAVVNQPAHGSVSMAANGGFVYTPSLNFNGTDTFTFRANDGLADSNAATISITVNAVNDAPVANNGSAIGNEDTPIAGTLAAVDVDSGALTFAMISQPAHGSVVIAANGGYTYTPSLDFNGSDSFTFRANDGALNSNVATVSITVAPVNDAPVLVNPLADQVVVAQSLFGVTLPANTFIDVDNATLTWSATLDSGSPLPAWLGFEAATRSFNGTAPAASVGSLSIKVTASDGGLAVNDVFVLTINAPPNSPPTSADGLATTAEDVALQGQLPAASDPNGDPITYAQTSGPAHGALTVNANGNFSYLPASNFSGNDTFSFSVSDGHGGINHYAMSVVVTPVVDTITGTAGNDVLVGFADADVLLGLGGNDALSPLGGNDTLDGGAGIDTAIFSTTTRANATVTASGFGWLVTTPDEGTDTLANVERLRFANTSVALDVDGSAGATAKIIGAVFGVQFLSNRDFVGIGLQLLDGGMSYANLVALAVGTDLFKQLAGATNGAVSNSQFVNFVYHNVVGALPSAGELGYYVGLLDQGIYTQSSLAQLAADTDLNKVHVNLVGLAQTGIEFTPQPGG